MILIKRCPIPVTHVLVHALDVRDRKSATCTSPFAHWDGNTKINNGEIDNRKAINRQMH